MARYRNDPNYAFWNMLKEGYDYFEITKVPPKVDVCEKRYVFNQTVGADGDLQSDWRLPATTQPDSLKMAYQSYQKNYDAAFAMPPGRQPQPKPTIGGLKEAQHRLRLDEEARPRRARADRAAVDGRRRHGDPDRADGPHRLAGRQTSGRGGRRCRQEGPGRSREKGNRARQGRGESSVPRRRARPQPSSPSLRPAPPYRKKLLSRPRFLRPISPASTSARKRIVNIFGS